MTKAMLTKAGRMLLLHRLQERDLLDDLTLQAIGDEFGVDRSTIFRDLRELKKVETEYERLMARQPWIRTQLTTTQFAREVSASPDIVRAMVRDGLVEGRKQGNRWMIPVGELEKFTSE